MRWTILAALYIGFASATATQAATIWDGPATSFAKAGFVDFNLPENQDRLTDNVWIARANSTGLFNAARETFYSANSPAGTEWAVGTTSDLGSLTFNTWNGTVGLSTPIGGPPSSVGVPMVLHLIDDDIYLDLTFTEWGQTSGAGGSFAYRRSTPGVPEPATVGLLVTMVAGGLVLRRRATRG